jgi:hypothetical protein
VKVEGVSAETVAKAEKIMLRVFFCTSGRKIILLLSGYDRARNRHGRPGAGLPGTPRGCERRATEAGGGIEQESVAAARLRAIGDPMMPVPSTAARTWSARRSAVAI